MTPYAGLNISRASRGSYSEGAVQAGVLDAQFSYDRFTAEQVSGSAGIRVNGALSSKVAYRIGAGLEHDFAYELDNFTLRGDFGSSAYASGIKPRANRVNGSAGLSLLTGKASAITVDGQASQYDYGSRAEYSIMVGFKIGL